ncbi:MAG: hypothetical protein ACRDK9_03950 [Solirubrobacterales bacterium]
MRAQRLIIRRWTGRLAEESGFAVPTVMLAVIAAFGLAGATVVASVGAQKGTVRDHDSKQALAAAEAGVNDALLSFNRVAHTEPTCVVGTVSGEWCQVGSQGLTGTGATYSYAVRPTENQIEIVSTGVTDGVSRRVEVVARSSSGAFPFAGDFSVIGLNHITLNNNATISANLATNGDITLSGPGSEVNCTAAQVGVGHQVTGNGDWNCPPAGQGTVSLPPVNQGDVATNNSNGLLPSGVPQTGMQPVWNALARELQIKPSSSLTLPSGNYSLCKLTMDSQAALYAAAGATVRIYFDSPEACGYGNGVVQLSMNASSRITTTGAGPTDLSLLFVGSETLNTRINFAHATQVGQVCEQDFVLYAPLSEIVMNAHSSFCGAMAGKWITLNSGADIFSSNLADDFQLPDAVAAHYSPEQFVECSATVGSVPDEGC